jgi:TIR domain
VLQAWDFVPGSNFVLEMDKTAQQAKRTIAVLSLSYLAASFPQPERGSAFAGDPTGAERKLVAVRVAECDPPGLLGQIVHVDLVGLAEAQARARCSTECASG